MAGPDTIRTVSRTQVPFECGIRAGIYTGLNTTKIPWITGVSLGYKGDKNINEYIENCHR